MMYKAKVAVCSDIRTKHSAQSEHHVEFLMLHLAVRTGTTRVQNVNCVYSCFLSALRHRQERTETHFLPKKNLLDVKKAEA